MKLFATQIVFGFSPEARVFAQLLGYRDSDVDATVLMHDQVDKHEPVIRFREVARCTVEPFDTGWRENTTGHSRGLLAKVAMAARYHVNLPKIDKMAVSYSPDVVYSCQQHFDLVAASHVASRLKKPQVIHLHYIVGPWLKSHALQRLLTCDHVITVSDFIRDEAIRHGVRPDRVTTVRNAMNPFPSVPKETSTNVRETIGVPSSAFLFGNVSRLDPGKGHLDIIAAFDQMAKSCPEAWLVIVGSGTIESEIKAAASASQFANRIILTGRRTDVPSLLGAMDAFVHPSRMDPCPLAVLEALSSALPVLAYAEGGAKEMVLHNGTGYLTEPGDVSELGGAMRLLYESPSTAKEMGARSVARIAADFRPEDAGRRFSEIVKSLV